MDDDIFRHAVLDIPNSSDSTFRNTVGGKRIFIHLDGHRVLQLSGSKTKEHSNTKYHGSLSCMRVTCPTWHLPLVVVSSHVKIHHVTSNVWRFRLDFCVGPHNYKFYFLGSVFTCASLVYGANLTLTCVCNPKYVFGILIPDDCDDAYYITQ